MAIQGQQPGEKKLRGSVRGGGTFWENVDWSRTKAYAMGLGQVYINLKGREGHGIVAPGDESTSVQNDLAARLLTMTDPNNGARMVDAVYKRDDVYSGEFVEERRPSCRSGWPTATASRGSRRSAARRRGIVYPNMKKWSGDHGSYDYKSDARAR